MFYFIFKVKLLQKNNIDLVNPLIPKAHYSEHWDKPFPFQIKH